MFKQLQEVSELDEKQSSRAPFGVVNCGIRVRDPSQMFVFSDTNWGSGFSNRVADSKESAGLLTKSKSQQAVIFGKSLIGNQCSGSVDHNFSNKEDGKSLGTTGFKNLFAKTENFDSIASRESAGLLTNNRSQQAGIFGKSLISNQCSGSVDHNLSNKEDGKNLGTKGFKNLFAKTENSVGFRSVPSHKSAGVLTNNRSQQAVFFGKSLTGNQCRGSFDHNLCNKEDGKSLGTKSFKTMFAKTENSDGFPLIPSHQSAGLLTKNRGQQAVIYGKSLIGNRFGGSVDHNLCNKEDGKDLGTKGFKKLFAKTDNSDGFHSIQSASSSVLKQPTVAEASRSDENHLSNMGHVSKQSQSLKSENDQLSSQKHMTWGIVSVKKEDGQRWSTSPTSTTPDAPVHQNPCVSGSCELPSTSYAANMVKDSQQNPSIDLQQLDVANQDTRSLKSKKRKAAANQNTPSLKSKKRKVSILERLPWHKEESEGSSSLHDISTAELAWAHAVARLPEKLEQLSEETAGSRWIINRKRRLSLTTKLMQLLFQPPPASVLTETAVTHCDVVAYYASKLALDDECCLRSLAGNNMVSKRSSEHNLIEVIEGFIGRAKRLEDDVKRLEKRGSLILEIKMDFQDLEKFSFISRLAKRHTARTMIEGDTRPSTSRKLYPQKYVQPQPMPKTVPDGQNCLFL